MAALIAAKHTTGYKTHLVAEGSDAQCEGQRLWLDERLVPQLSPKLIGRPGETSGDVLIFS